MNAEWGRTRSNPISWYACIIQSFYGTAPRRSYWNGCSTGGRQGLTEAQKFPDDFDGIAAGAPANRNPIGLWIAFAVLKNRDSCIPPSKYPMIHRAALDACDTLDGLKDGLIGNPAACNFDPGALLGKQADSPDCLPAPPVEAARKIYTPGTNPRTGQELFPAPARGSELGWGSSGGGPEPTALTLDQYRYIVFKDPNWDWRSFNFDRDVSRPCAASSSAHSKAISYHFRRGFPGGAGPRLKKPESEDPLPTAASSTRR